MYTLGRLLAGIRRFAKKRKMDLEPHAFEALEKAGIKRGKTVLDFGCGSGTYTIPAAKIVGEEGKIYALDKDIEKGKVLNFRKRM